MTTRTTFLVKRPQSSVFWSQGLLPSPAAPTPTLLCPPPGPLRPPQAGYRGQLRCCRARKDGPAREPTDSSALPCPQRAVLGLASRKPCLRHAHHPCHAHALCATPTPRPNHVGHAPTRPHPVGHAHHPCHARATPTPAGHAHHPATPTPCPNHMCHALPRPHPVGHAHHTATPTPCAPRPSLCHAHTLCVTPAPRPPPLPRPHLAAPTEPCPATSPAQGSPAESPPATPPAWRVLPPALVHPALSLDRGSSPSLVGGVPPSPVAQLWGEDAGLSFISCYK